MIKVKFIGGALYYEGRRYAKGDVLSISDQFFAGQANVFQVVEQDKPRAKKRKKVEQRAAPAEVPSDTEVSGDGHYTGDSIGL